LLTGFKKAHKFSKGLGAQLPPAYKKFWIEWRIKQPTAVHYIPKEGKFERNPLTGQVTSIQNIPIPMMFPKESHDGLWGGEGIIKGFQKRTPTKRRVPHFWVPVLRRSVVHSEILNEYLSVIVTDRTINLIHECHGFDHYLLKSPACDLRSRLALKLKRKILINLQDGCKNWSATPDRQSSLLNEYNKYLVQYTPEEIDWYGLGFEEAIMKLKHQIDAADPIVPQKILFRSRLIEQLKEARIAEAQGGVDEM
jgi:large subunit ribosomal protein L28